jgi:hypothetical protein
MVGPTSAASFVSESARASADMVEVSVKNSGGSLTEAVVEAEEVDAPKDVGGQRVEGVDPPKPSVVNPMPAVLGDDSSSSEDAGYGSQRCPSFGRCGGWGREPLLPCGHFYFGGVRRRGLVATSVRVLERRIPATGAGSCRRRRG